MFLLIICFFIIISGCTTNTPSEPTNCFKNISNEDFDFVIEVKVEENIRFKLFIDDHTPISSSNETDWISISFFSKQPSKIFISAVKNENATEKDGLVIRVTNNLCENVSIELGAQTDFVSFIPTIVSTYTDGNISLPRYWVPGEKSLLFGFDLRVNPVRP